MATQKVAGRSVEKEIALLRDLDLQCLRARWRSVLRSDAPLHLPRHLLFAVLAYRLQADELGDLAPDAVRLLRQIGASADRPRPEWPRQAIAAQSSSHIRRFTHLINVNGVFGTHNPPIADIRSCH
jgi:hypothetical protein